jgi:hypothetical protein
MTKTITLTKGLSTIVDDEDLEQEGALRRAAEMRWGVYSAERQTRMEI